MPTSEPAPDAELPVAESVPVVSNSRRFEASQWTWFLAWVGVTAVAAYLKPDHVGHGTHQQLGLPPCPSVIIFGRPCPACGLTTSWTSTVHGDLPGAFDAHPLGTALYLLFTASAFIAAYGAIRHIRYSTETAWFNRAAIVVGIIFFGYGAYRFWSTPPGYRTTYESAWSRAAGTAGNNSSHVPVGSADRK